MAGGGDGGRRRGQRDRVSRRAGALLRLPPAFLWAVAGIAITAAAGTAQSARPLLDPPAFKLDQWTTRDGLPQNSVTSIAQAPEGHLWIGTFGGLARFDGANFHLVERTDSLGRHLDRILSLAVGPDSALWIGTEEDGLFRYRDGAFQHFTPRDGLPSLTIGALHVARDGALWVGGEQGGIARLAGARFERFPDADGVPFDNIISFVESADGTIWVNTGARFVTIEGGRPTTRRWRASPVDNANYFVLEDRAGAEWISQPNSMARVTGGRVTVFGGLERIPGAIVMVEDPAGGYWLGTGNDGLFFFRSDDRRESVRYPLPEGRLSYRVRVGRLDLEGNIWFGTDANGLLRAKRNVFTTYTAEHGLSYDVATAIYADRAGVIWAATNCWGVNAMDLTSRTVRLFKPRRPNDPAGDPCVFALTESPAGTMWAGTYGGGLSRLENGREYRLGWSAAGLADSVVLALFTDRDGAVWVGTNRGGLAALRDGRIQATYGVGDGLAHQSVRTIYQTRDGAIWAGTLEGLSRLEAGKLTTYTGAHGLSAGHVRSLYQDDAGTLWVGTYGGGLNRFKAGVFTPITREHGLADDVVSAILEDERGYFWMSGNRGIYRVARSELEEFADGRRPRIHSVLYGATDGLLNAETNGGFQPAGWKDTYGRMWFPTVRGVAMVDPARVRLVERPPPVTIDEILVDGEPRPGSLRLVVGPGRPNLEFRYAGLSLSAPEHVIFRYRLDGFDDAWVEAGTRRVAYYPGLPPGRFTFAVMAANRDGVWSPAATTLGVRVIAPVWMTWWFRTIAALAFVGILVLLLRRRELAIRRGRAAQEEFSRRLIESQEHERRRIAGELHDGLGQELLVVKNRALMALQVDGINPPVREQLQHITTVASQSLESVRTLAHNLTPRQLDHLGLSAALRSMIAVTAESAGIGLRVTVDDVDGLLPTDRQIDLYRVVQEGLSNVVHHAAATSASVYIRRAGQELRVTIVDDGRGFQVRRDERGRLVGGFGLSGIAERVRMLQGRIEVSSTPGRGTSLEVAVPVPRAEASRPA